MSPLKFELRCENCSNSLVVTYDADVPTRVLEFYCLCGHTTPVREVPDGLSIRGQLLPDGGIKLWRETL